MLLEIPSSQLDSTRMTEKPFLLHGCQFSRLVMSSSRRISLLSDHAITLDHHLEILDIIHISCQDQRVAEVGILATNIDCLRHFGAGVSAWMVQSIDSRELSESFIKAKTKRELPIALLAPQLSPLPSARSQNSLRPPWSRMPRCSGTPPSYY